MNRSEKVVTRTSNSAVKVTTVERAISQCTVCHHSPIFLGQKTHKVELHH